MLSDITFHGNAGPCLNLLWLHAPLTFQDQASAWPWCVGSGVSQEQVRLIDDQTFETVDVLPLHRHEMACSCVSLTLADDPNPYYVVGTAYAIPDEQEPTKVS